MSRVYFDSLKGGVELPGSERAYIACFCNDLLLAALPPAPDARQLLPEGAWPLGHHGDSAFREALRTWVAAAPDAQAFTLPDGTNVPVFEAALNTALACGADPLRLGARIHGQCEIHCWVNGGDRRWLASVVREGLDQGFFRPKAGWEEVESFLRGDWRAPAVLSYSVCRRFPHPQLAREAGLWVGRRPDGDDWYELNRATQWDLGMRALKKRPGLRLKPEGWALYRVGAKLSGFDIAHAFSAAATKENP